MDMNMEEILMYEWEKNGQTKFEEEKVFTRKILIEKHYPWGTISKTMINKSIKSMEYFIKRFRA